MVCFSLRGLTKRMRKPRVDGEQTGATNRAAQKPHLAAIDSQRDSRATIANDGCLQMSKLTVFGLFAVTAMLLFYALEKRSPWFVLAFAASCAMGSVYGFLQGAWPFGIVEAVWSLVAARKWWLARSQFQ